MPSQRSLFLHHVAQTSPWPMVIEVEKAEGMYLYDQTGKRFLDFDSGFSVSSLGHRHPVVMKALEDQMGKYLHTTVYGEHIQSPQIQFALKLSQCLGPNFSTLYYTNSGSEAVEVALKAGRKLTGRYKALSCKNAYHGSTLGAESLRSDVSYTSALMPGVPGIDHMGFNNWKDLEKIDSSIGIIIMEVVQAEAGVILPEAAWLKAVRDKCDEHGCLLAFDEIQTGFGRTGKLFAYLHYDVTPDLLIMAKAMGGGMPIGAVAGSEQMMHCFSHQPALGHITTFGGHPMSLAAAVAVIHFIADSGIMGTIGEKELQFRNELRHPAIKEIRSAGLLMAVTLQDGKYLNDVVSALLEAGLMVDYFLFNANSFRIAPPLIVEAHQIKEGCAIIREVLDKVIG